MKKAFELFPALSGPKGLNAILYGPTENTVISTAYKVPQDIDVGYLGRPNPNVFVYIVDSSYKLVPRGAPGELIMAGPRVTEGYISRDDLTKQAFIRNPYFAETKRVVPAQYHQYYTTCYRSGDLVRWAPDGNLEYLGRIDRQVKINGVRIELGEVETALNSAIGVTAAVAIGRKDDSGRTILVGYVTPDDVDIMAVRATCKTTLVPAMVPSHIVAVREFKLLPNGKVDVNALPPPPKPQEAAAATAAGFVTPKNSIEEAVAAIWQEVLGLEGPVSADADFFAIGGSSLQAGLVNGRIRHELNIPTLPGTAIFANQTVSQLAVFIHEHAAAMEPDGQQRRRGGMLAGLSQRFTFSSGALSRLDTVQLFAEKFVARRNINARQGDAQKRLQAVAKTQLWYLVYVFIQYMLCAIAYLAVPATFSLTSVGLILAWGNLGVWWAVLIGLAFWPASMALMVFFLIAFKWIVLGRVPQGAHPVNGWLYARWAAVTAMGNTILPMVECHLRRSSLGVWTLRALGAKIGKNVILDTISIRDWDMISIGDNVTVHEKATVLGSFLVPSQKDMGQPACLVFSTTIIGKDCEVGMAATISAGGIIPDGYHLKPAAALGDTNSLMPGPLPDEVPHFAEQLPGRG